MPVASKRGECIHCGACNPVEKEKCCWLHRILFILLVVGTILATLQYDAAHRAEPNCGLQDSGRGGGC
jgi:hypothetical protein